MLRNAPRSLLLPLLCLAAAACGTKDNPITPAVVTCDPAAGTVSADGQPIPVAPNGYATVGNRIISVATCDDFRFLGISRPSLAFSPTGDRMGSDTALAADISRIRSWKANTVRIELAQYFWVPTARHYNASYAARVERAVKAARDAGLRVILALQVSDRGDPNYPGDIYATNTQQPMADVNHSIPFWKDVASRFKNDGNVLFEVYSEPYPIGGANGFSNWALWLNGGEAPADKTYDALRAPFQAAGMQQLYDAVRSTGAHNVVIVSGTSWGYFLNRVRDYPVQGYNIVYSSHPWDWPGKQPETWQQDWASLAATHPVMITEFGNYDCRTPYIKAVLDKADQLELSWVAWAWIAPGPTSSKAQNGRGDPICEFPMLITDWGGTPSKIGQVVKDRLAGY